MIDWDDLEARNTALGAFVDWDRGAMPGTGPLAGLTIGVKSNIAVAGLPWTAGMGTRRGVIAPRDAAVVATLRAAGAAILGTLNMHEAALGAVTDNAFYGRTHNAHRHGFTPGGSSGGSGAAVGAGLCDAALGTDTLGSVRIPAAYNGVYGLKPTNGAVDEDGLVPLGKRFDCIGVLARDLTVLERVWTTVAQQQARPRLTRRIVLTELAGVEVQPGVQAAYDCAVEALSGGTDAIALPASPSRVRRAALAEAGRELIAALASERDGPGVSGELKTILTAIEGIALDPALLDATRASIVGALGSDGVLVMPTTPHAPFAHGTPAPASQADFTGLANVAGLPALAVPVGRNKDGLPVGVQLVGPAGSELSLIDLARAIEPVLGRALSTDSSRR